MIISIALGIIAALVLTATVALVIQAVNEIGSYRAGESNRHVLMAALVGNGVVLSLLMGVLVVIYIIYSRGYV